MYFKGEINPECYNKNAQACMYNTLERKLSHKSKETFYTFEM